MTLCFFFQAEDGIRGGRVTGVQTCALPISDGTGQPPARAGGDATVEVEERPAAGQSRQGIGRVAGNPPIGIVEPARQELGQRSEERRVGKEGSSRWRQSGGRE